jgi:hypothetical protein
VLRGLELAAHIAPFQLLIPHYPQNSSHESILEMLHRKDFCQPRGIVSEMKHRKEGGPSLKQWVVPNQKLKIIAASKRVPSITGALDYSLEVPSSV